MPTPKQQPATSCQTYATPPEFVLAVYSYLGCSGFTFDFAADSINHKAPDWFDEETDALSVPDWQDYMNGGWGWLNPPFKKIGPWAQRCLEASKVGGRIAFLVPASVGSNWFRDFIYGQHGVKVLYLNGRIKFMPDKPNWLYPKDLMLVFFGTEEPFATEIWTWRNECLKPLRTNSRASRKLRKSLSNASLPLVLEKSGRSKLRFG